MPQTYTTRQFQAGNSQAVRLPASMAFPAKTELIVTREGDKIVVQPMQKTLENVPLLFSSLKKHALDAGAITRPEFIDAERDWGNNGSKKGSKA